MNPAFIDAMSWEMAEVYGAVTDQILINLARRFKYFDASTLPRSGFAYQAKMLAQMGQVRRETINIIRNNLDDADDALVRVLEEAIIDSIKATEPELLKGVKGGVLNFPQTPVLAPNQMQAFKYYYRQSADKLNLVNTVMLESTEQAYRTAVSDIVSEIGLAEAMNRVQIGLDSATGEVVTGVSSWNQAVRHATDKMRDAGIVGFIDHGGHRWSAEAYAAMDIRTTVANTARSAVWETNQNFGNDLYLVSYHNGARPLCYPWQNKVISSLDRSGVTYDLDGNEITIYPQSSTSYGEPAGLFGINCKHYPTPFIPGVSVADGQPQDKEENDRVYAESQEQRRLERKLREEKRDLMMAKAQGASEEEINALREKCRNSSQDIDDFCASTGRQRRRNREGVYTKRDFPDADKYDPATFAKEQKQLMEEYRKYGGAQTGNTFGVMTPNVPIAPTTPPAPVQPVTTAQPVVQANPEVATFTPAKTLQEAEQFARDNFVDTNMWASQGISLQGISVDSANIVNERLSSFYSTYKVDKFSSLVAPAGNTKLGKAIKGAQAGFNPLNRAMVLNRNNLKSPGLVVDSLREERELVAEYLTNPERFSKLDSYTKKLLEASRKSGRFTVATDLGEILDHECGHALEKALRNVDNYDAIVANMGDFAEKLSGYATTSSHEYIAESFCAWKNGEAIDPLLSEAFESLRR